MATRGFFIGDMCVLAGWLPHRRRYFLEILDSTGAFILDLQYPTLTPHTIEQTLLQLTDTLPDRFISDLMVDQDLPPSELDVEYPNARHTMTLSSQIQKLEDLSLGLPALEDQADTLQKQLTAVLDQIAEARTAHLILARLKAAWEDITSPPARGHEAQIAEPDPTLQATVTTLPLPEAAPLALQIPEPTPAASEPEPQPAPETEISILAPAQPAELQPATLPPIPAPNGAESMAQAALAQYILRQLNGHWLSGSQVNQIMGNWGRKAANISAVLGKLIDEKKAVRRQNEDGINEYTYQPHFHEAAARNVSEPDPEQATNTVEKVLQENPDVDLTEKDLLEKANKLYPGTRAVHVQTALKNLQAKGVLASRETGVTTTYSLKKTPAPAAPEALTDTQQAIVRTILKRPLQTVQYYRDSLKWSQPLEDLRQEITRLVQMGVLSMAPGTLPRYNAGKKATELLGA